MLLHQVVEPDDERRNKTEQSGADASSNADGRITRRRRRILQPELELREVTVASSRKELVVAGPPVFGDIVDQRRGFVREGSGFGGDQRNEHDADCRDTKQNDGIHRQDAGRTRPATRFKFEYGSLDDGRKQNREQDEHDDDLNLDDEIEDQQDDQQ